MTAVWILLAGAAAAAVTDWVAVATGNHRLEYVAKPAVLATLIAAAAVIPAQATDLVDRRWWFVGALVCCLIGDVLLMLPRDLFVPGLAAFLGGHVLFIVGLLHPPTGAAFSFSFTGLAVATMAVVVAEIGPGLALYRSLVRGGHRQLIGPVACYVVAIGTLVVLATNVAAPAAAVGAVLFLASDTVLALNRFVRPVPRGQLVVHVTYHLAQGLLVLSLLR